MRPPLPFADVITFRIALRTVYKRPQLPIERGIQLSALWPRRARPGVALMLGHAAHLARFPCGAAARHWRASHAAPLRARQERVFSGEH